MRRRPLRLLRYAAYAWLAYLLIGNLVLNTALGSALINRKPEKFRLDWQHALTLWPGQAWLWDVHAQGHSRRIAWQAQAGRAGGRIALLALFGKQLRIPDISAYEVGIEIDRVAEDLLPPEPRPDGWTLRLDAIASDSVRMLRIGDWHLDGAGQARFGVRKQLRGGPLEILPSALRMSTANLRVGDVAVLADARIDGSFALPSHRRERAPGLSQLGLADARLSVAGALPALTIALDERGRWNTDVVPSSNGGRFELDLALTHGVLEPGGRLHAAVPLAATDAAGERWSGEGTLDLRVDENVDLKLHLPPPPGDGGRFDVALNVAGRALPFACSDPSPADAALGPSCSVDAHWHHQLRRLSGDVAVRWHFDSLRWLGPLLARADWLHLDGAGEIDADLRIAEGELAAGSTLAVPALDAVVEVLDNRIEGRARAKARIEAAESAGTRTQLELTLERFQMRPTDAPNEVHVRGRDLRLDLEAVGTMAAARESLRGRLRFANAEVPDLTVYNRYLPHDGLRLLGGRGTLGGDLQLDAAGEVGHGRLDVGARSARLRLGDVELDGDIALNAQLERADLARRVFDLDGTSVQLSNVRVVDAERAGAGDWWARGQLQRGRVHWGRPLQVDAQLDASAKDVGLLLGLFARHRDYPRWTLRLVDAGQARVDGRVRMDGQALTLDPLHAANDRFDVKGRLHVADRQPRGDLLLSWGRLAVGLELAGGERHWHLRHASEWFAGRAAPP